MRSACRIFSFLLILVLLNGTVCQAEKTSSMRSAHLRAVGDVMSHTIQLRVANKGDGVYDYMPQFEGVRESLSRADYTIANLETCIDDNRSYSSFPCFNTPISFLDAIQSCGVDMLSMANNHVMDGRVRGLISTVDKVESYGFDHVGAYRTKEESETPVVVEVNGIKFGFVAYTFSCNGVEESREYKQQPYVVPMLKNADIEGDVQRLKDAGAEVIIALPHWGVEYYRHVSPELRKLAQRMLDAGVDIILGSHPHVVLPMELVELARPDGTMETGLIAWSMGNFLSGMVSTYTDSGIIVDFTVYVDKNGSCTVDHVGYVPVYVWKAPQEVRLLCSQEFLDCRPEGMDKYAYNLMCASNAQIEKMIGPGFHKLLN